MQKTLQVLGGRPFSTTRVSVSYITGDSSEQVTRELLAGRLPTSAGYMITQATITETRTTRLRMLAEEK